MSSSSAFGTPNSKLVEIIAHRGASSDAPENTLAAIQLAWQQGADAAEIDVQLTADGQLIAIHDETMLRTGGVDWAVKDRPLAELKTLDVGSWKSPQFANERIPTLSEVLDIVPLGKRLFIEVKCGADSIPELVRVLSAAKTAREQTVLIGLDFDTIAAVKQALPDRTACWVTEQFADSDSLAVNLRPMTAELIARAVAAKLDGLDINNLPERPSGDIRQITQAGLQAYVWTVNSADRAAWHQAEGIQGITTDVPGPLSVGLLFTTAWALVEDGLTIGTHGSESGIILLDEEYESAARITLEQNGQIAPFAITCGLYGWMCHTRFFGSEAVALEEYERMKVSLSAIVGIIPQVSDSDCDENMKRVSEAIRVFVDQFP